MTTEAGTIIVGCIELGVISLLGLNIEHQPIFWGESNREHVEINHPLVYTKYGSVLPSVISGILKAPDYVGSRNNAIEYVKLMPDRDILKVAVRASKKGVYYARTMYLIRQSELIKFLAKSTLVKIS